MGFFDKVLDVGTLGAYGAFTGKGFDITGKGAAADAIKDAKNATQAGTNATLGVLKDQYGVAQGYQNPLSQFGMAALPYLQAAILGGNMPNGQTFMNQPMSYTGQMQNQGYQRALASRGLLGSGQAAMGTGQIQAQDAERRMQDLWRMLGVGQTANQNLSNMATNYGSQVGNAYTGNANELSNLYGQQGQLATSYSPFNLAMSGMKAVAPLLGGL